MLRAYVDESYCDDWFFMVAALAYSQEQVRNLERSFAALLRSESERLAIPTPSEVHGYDLFQGVDMWGDVRLFERLAISAKIINLMAEADIRFVVRGIDRAAQRRRYPEAYSPYPMILTHVAREVDRLAGERKTYAEITCDEYHQHDRHRAMLDRHRTLGTPGYRRSTLPNIRGDLTFLPSHESALIQAADIVAYLRHRIALRPSPPYKEKRARGHLWAKVEAMLLHEYCWVP